MSAYLRPATLEAALEARGAHPDHVVLAGGTDLMVGVTRRAEPPGVIDVFGVPGLVGVAAEDGWLRVGAATTYAALLRDELVRAELPILWEASREVGAVQIQERGTLGGNVATSSPVGDTLPVLLALDAEVELGSTRGRRRVPYHAFCTGYRRTALGGDELIVALWFPRLAGRRQFWRKVGTRRAQAISKVMVAAAARLEANGAAPRLVDVRLAMGAVADRPIRLRQAEALLEGQVPGEDLAHAVDAAVREEIVPITDVRSTAGYRLRTAARLAARFVRELAGP